MSRVAGFTFAWELHVAHILNVPCRDFLDTGFSADGRRLQSADAARKVRATLFLQATLIRNPSNRL